MSGFGVLNPAGAFTLAAIGLLILLYLYDRRRRVVPVATMFLWKRIAAQPLQRERFRPDALFWMRLVLLGALIAAYVRPFVEDRGAGSAGAPLIVVLDTSASMQAREVGGTRFELARQRAAALLRTLEDGAEAMLITAAERPHVAQRWSADRTRLADRLATLAPTDTPTRLGAAIELAFGEASARPQARVAVVTDLPPEASGVTPAALARVDYLQVGATDDNVGILSLTVDRPPFRAPTEASATALIRNYAAVPKRVAFTARVGADPWEQRVLTLPPRASEPVLLVHPPHGGALVVTIDAGDALAVDDHAAAWISPGEPLDLLLVTDSRELAAAFGAVAAAVPGSKVEVVSRARYAERLPGGRRTALFDGIVPDTLPPAVNALYVAPPAGNTLCPVAAFADNAAVVDWESEHPAVSGLATLQALEVGRAGELTSPAWATPVVLAASRRRAFPLLVAGEHEGRRTACLGAELAAPLASSDHLPLLVLTLSALRWLAEPYAGTAVTVATGAPVVAGPGPTQPIDGPDGGAGLRVIGDPPVLLAERAGIYRMGPSGGERLVFANLFDDRESDIGRDGVRDWRATTEESAPPPPAKRELGWWLYVAALALLACEWALWWRRRASGAAETETLDIVSGRSGGAST